MTTANPVLQRGFDPAMVGLDLVPVTPSDSADLETPARALRIKTGGTLRITTYTGEVRDTEVADGELLPVFVVRVHETGTAATGIEAVI